MLTIQLISITSLRGYVDSNIKTEVNNSTLTDDEINENIEVVETTEKLEKELSKNNNKQIIYTGNITELLKVREKYDDTTEIIVDNYKGIDIKASNQYSFLYETNADVEINNEINKYIETNFNVLTVKCKF